VEAEVVWARDGVQQERVLHGLRVIADETGKELFTIGAILRSFFG
jgi:hypothetical protein